VRVRRGRHELPVSGNSGKGQEFKQWEKESRGGGSAEERSNTPWGKRSKEDVGGVTTHGQKEGKGYVVSRPIQRGTNMVGTGYGIKRRKTASKSRSGIGIINLKLGGESFGTLLSGEAGVGRCRGGGGTTLQLP